MSTPNAIVVDAAEYLAIGFGSHHWSVIDGDQRWFVTVDDLDAKKRRVDDPRDAVFRRLHASMNAARVVADDGLEFVVAPVRTVDNAVVSRLDDRFAAAVYPFVDGTSYPYGDFPAIEHRDAVIAMIARLHDVADPAATGAAPDDLQVPCRADLSVAVDALAQPWESGPFAEPARELLDRHASGVERLFEHYDRVAASVAGRPERMVLTHGEPHPGNTVMTAVGWVLVDWDTTLIAAPERDLWMMADVADSAVGTYEAATGRNVLQEALDCYRLWWDLAEICGYVTLLRENHNDTTHPRVMEELAALPRPRSSLATTARAPILTSPLPTAFRCAASVNGVAERRGFATVVKPTASYIPGDCGIPASTSNSALALR